MAALQVGALHAVRQQQKFPFPNNFLDILQLLPLRKLIQPPQLQHQQFSWSGKLSKNIKGALLKGRPVSGSLTIGFSSGQSCPWEEGEREGAAQAMLVSRTAVAGEKSAGGDSERRAAISSESPQTL